MNYAIETISIKTIKNTNNGRTILTTDIKEINLRLNKNGELLQIIISLINTDKPDFVMPPETFQMLINEGIINL
jgi:hypothetical protein